MMLMLSYLLESASTRILFENMDFIHRINLKQLGNKDTPDTIKSDSYFDLR